MGNYGVWMCQVFLLILNGNFSEAQNTVGSPSVNMVKKGFFDKKDLQFVGGNIVLAVVVGIVILVSLILFLIFCKKFSKFCNVLIILF